ncbi:MAG: hypothetical protein SF187_23570 [Deltaproteobacteria bacterium]|nr:hypothetical protein [Deltaproteobacteria bacterium]
MAANARERIDSWVGQLLANTPQAEGVAIVLVHAAVDQTQRVVKSWRLEDAVTNLEALVTEIDEVAEGDAEGLGGRQRYLLKAQVRGKDIGSMAVRYELRNDGGTAAVDSEPATTAGSMALLQRHAEGAMRMMVQSFGGVIESYKEQVNAQKALIAEFQKQAADNFRLQEELASRKLEQDLLLQERQTQLQLSAAKEANEIQKSQLLWGHGLTTLMKMAPSFLYYVSGGKAGTRPEELLDAKATPTPVSDQISDEQERQLFGNATEDTIAAWKAELAPAQVEYLMARLADYRARNPAVVSSNGDPSVAPTHAPLRKADTALAQFATHLYETLARHRHVLQPLAMALMARQNFASLSEDDARLLGKVAADAGIDGVAESQGGERLWMALLSQELMSLAPIVTGLNAGKTWSGLPQGDKLLLLKMAQQVGQLG